MKLDGKTRLFIALSVAWLIFWAWGYLVERHMALTTRIEGFTLFGILPVAIPWTIAWIWKGFRNDRSN